MATPAAISETSVRPAVWPRVLLLLGRVALGIIYPSLPLSPSCTLTAAGISAITTSFFGMTINSYNILPIWAVEWAARILPWFELALGILLIVGVGLRWTGLIASLLLIGFIAAMTRAYMNGLEIMCWLLRKQREAGAAHVDSRQQPAHPRSRRDHWRVSD